MPLPPPVELPQQLVLAKGLWRPLRRMSAYAAFDGWSLLFLGLLTLICGGYGSMLGLLLSIALLGTGLFELRTVRQLRRLDAVALNRLATNQLVLAGALALYAIISLILDRNGSSSGLSAEIQQALAQAGATTGAETSSPAGGAGDAVSTAMTILYTGLIATALVVQGGTAAYYFSRRKHLERYLAEVPEWIQQMQRERGEV